MKLRINLTWAYLELKRYRDGVNLGPPHTSKYNPIEHRLFPHLTRVCEGVIFETVEIIQDLMATAKTKTGLNVFTTIFNKVYQTGRKVPEAFKTSMDIVFDVYLPKWNYTAQPQMA